MKNLLKMFCAVAAFFSADAALAQMLHNGGGRAMRGGMLPEEREAAFAETAAAQTREMQNVQNQIQNAVEKKIAEMKESEADIANGVNDAAAAPDHHLDMTPESAKNADGAKISIDAHAEPNAANAALHSAQETAQMRKKTDTAQHAAKQNPPPNDAQKNPNNSKDQNTTETSDSALDSLIRRYPFFESSAGGTAAGAGGSISAPKGLELRSISCVNDKWYFGLADTALKKFYVVPLDKRELRTQLPYSVDFFDDETNSISVSDNTGFYTLTLKQPDTPKGRVVPLFGTPKGAGAKPANAANTRIRLLQK